MKVENINTVNNLVKDINRLEDIISILNDSNFSRFESVKKIFI